MSPSLPRLKCPLFIPVVCWSLDWHGAKPSADPFWIRYRFMRLVSRSIANSLALAHHSGEWARGAGVELLGNAAREESLSPGLNGMAHGFGHEHSILRLGDGRVHEHAIGAQLHGHGGIGSGAHAGVDDQRHLGDAFAQDTQ